MEIFLDYARRLDLRDKDGQPLVKWSTPEECFEAWKECTRGRPCDYTGLSYDKLRGGSGIQWPCNDEAPDGTERLYADLTFPTFPEICEDYGHDLADRSDVVHEADFKALEPARPRDPEGGGVDAAARVGAATSTRSRSRPAAPSTTSTRARRPAAHPSCRPPRPTPGSSCARPTPSGSGSRRATCCASRRRAARSKCLRASAAARGGRLRPVPLRLLGHRRRRRP